MLMVEESLKQAAWSFFQLFLSDTNILGAVNALLKGILFWSTAPCEAIYIATYLDGHWKWTLDTDISPFTKLAPRVSTKSASWKSTWPRRCCSHCALPPHAFFTAEILGQSPDRLKIHLTVEAVIDVIKSSQSDLNRFQRREMWNIYVGSDIVAFGAFWYFPCLHMW